MRQEPAKVVSSLGGESSDLKVTLGQRSPSGSVSPGGPSSHSRPRKVQSGTCPEEEVSLLSFPVRRKFCFRGDER